VYQLVVALTLNFAGHEILNLHSTDPALSIDQEIWTEMSGAVLRSGLRRSDSGSAGSVARARAANCGRSDEESSVLTAVQLLWINLIMDTVSRAAIARIERVLRSGLRRSDSGSAGSVARARAANCGREKQVSPNQSLPTRSRRS
jgi:hypothetical protein